MRQNVKTIATQAAQVWMTADLRDLGWQRGPVLVSAMEGPFETWADMTHTLAAERAWRAHPNCPPGIRDQSDVKSIAYFCGVLPQREVDERARRAGGDRHRLDVLLREKIEADLERLLDKGMTPFWPGVPSLLSRLATRDGAQGGTLAEQHLQASFAGSDRYTLAVPGSLEHRISPLARLVVNMTIAGDWTECGFNEGCIEAAVMSGMLASHAISRKPGLDDIIGYNHP
jgi:hypothetical protein